MNTDCSFIYNIPVAFLAALTYPPHSKHAESVRPGNSVKMGSLPYLFFKFPGKKPPSLLSAFCGTLTGGSGAVRQPRIAQLQTPIELGKWIQWYLGVPLCSRIRLRRGTGNSSVPCLTAKKASRPESAVLAPSSHPWKGLLGYKSYLTVTG